MKYLLDTHIILWAALDVRKLSRKAMKILEDPDNILYFSPVSLWDEIPPEKVELKMFDVIYASTGGKHFQYREKHCTVTDENGKALNLLRGKFAGYAKMCGWSYEREVRLLLTLKKDYVVPDMEKVSIDFSGVVKCMKTNKLIYKAYPILLGPWTIPSKRDELAKRKLKDGKSLFTGYLDNLKTVCDKCTKSCMAKCKCAHKYAR